MKVMEDVPYVKGLTKFIGTELNADATAYLKDFGAATASNGAVGLYHIDGLTPEAVELGEKLIADGAKTYVIDDAELSRVKNSYPCIWKDPNATPKLCFVGCPSSSCTTGQARCPMRLQSKVKRRSRSRRCSPPRSRFRRNSRKRRIIRSCSTWASFCPTSAR
jgi:predicted aconitase